MRFPEYERHDAIGLAELVRSGEVGTGELLEAAVERIERRDLRVNAVVTTMFEMARERVARGLPDGPFTGVPFLLKDLSIAYPGVPLTGGSRSLRDYVPDYMGEVAARYERSGLVILGKTSTPEFGMKPSTESALHGTTVNPWNPAVTAGGSSGGAAAAVAAGMVPAANASDGAGSIRIPASHCGLFGLKPTRARTPVGPVYGEGWFGLSAVHAVTRSVRDSAALLDVTHGPEPGDPYAAPPPARPFLDEVGADPGRLRVGAVPGGILGPVTDPEVGLAVDRAAGLLADLGHEVGEVALPVDVEELTWAFVVLTGAQVAHGIRMSAVATGREKPERSLYEPATWLIGLLGRVFTAADVAEALFVIRRTGREVGRMMEDYDVLLTSTLARRPWPHHELEPTDAEERLVGLLGRVPAKPALRAAVEQLSPRVLGPVPNTPVFNVTGQPAMSVPLHWTPDGLPVGIQIAGRFGDEATLFRLAGQLESARPWFDRRPPGF
jgi:amidase